MNVAFGVESRAHGNEVRVDVEDIGDNLRCSGFVTLAATLGYETVVIDGW